MSREEKNIVKERVGDLIKEIKHLYPESHSIHVTIREETKGPISTSMFLHERGRTLFAKKRDYSLENGLNKTYDAIMRQLEKTHPLKRRPTTAIPQMVS